MPTHTIDYSVAQDGSDPEVYTYADSRRRSLETQDDGVNYLETCGGNDEVEGEDWPRVLIDDHNRYESCTRLGLLFEVVNKEFLNRDDATEWITNNQFGRRNLSDYQRGVPALRMKPTVEVRTRAKQSLAC